jgi:hypothetical protein
MGTLNKIAKLLNWDKPTGYASKRYTEFVNFGDFKSEFGGDIMLSDVVKTAIHRIAEALSKCVLKSVIERNAPRSVVVADDEINALFGSRVNPFMTTKDFLYKIGYLTIVNENCFVYPAYDEIPVGEGYCRRVYTGFYPLEGIAKGTIYHNGAEARIELIGDKGQTYDMPYADIIHIRRNFGQNAFLGGDANGRMSVRALLKNLQTLQTVKEAIPKTLEAALSIKGVLTMKGMPEFDTRKTNLKEFEEHITSSRYGLIATDYATDFTAVNIQATDIPKEAMALIYQEILYPFGVSMGIMAGKYDDVEYSAFYQTAIEGFLTSISQAFTATLFTANQLTRGHKIKAYDRLVQSLSMERRIKIVELVKDIAILDADEQRELLGYEPNGQPTRVSLNYVETPFANDYQLGTAKPIPPPAPSDKANQTTTGGEANAI